MSTVAHARAYALAMHAPSNFWLEQPYCQGQCPGLHPCMSSCHGWNPCHGRHPCQCQGHGLHPCQSQGQGIRPCQGQGLDVGPVNAVVTVFILATACTNIHDPLATKCNDGQGLSPSHGLCPGQGLRPCHAAYGGHAGGGGVGLSATQ